MLKERDRLMVAVEAAAKYVILWPNRGVTSEAAYELLLEMSADLEVTRGMFLIEDVLLYFYEEIIHKSVVIHSWRRAMKTLIQIASNMGKENGS